MDSFLLVCAAFLSSSLTAVLGLGGCQLLSLANYVTCLLITLLALRMITRALCV